VGHDDVAVIGAATLLPGVTDLADLHARLCEGFDAVGQPDADRVRYTGGTPGTRYVSISYLDRVDLFDHRFFGLSLREAELMDPHQRLLVQLAHRAVENAGYAAGRLRGTRTAVVLGEATSEYQNLVDDDDPQRLLGGLPAALAARVAYLLDLVGPAVVVDTACSSSLTALADATRMLRDGVADLALVGGISVLPVLVRDADYAGLRGVDSPTSTCRPFDVAADGAVGGEGGGIVLLKPLARAVADRDNVLCVLKGVAVNHNGYRAASMGAPSQVAQAEVITAAWRDAKVDAESVGYVECHGSATPLGDVIEVDALRRAFVDAGVTTPHCPIGSVKGNIGHLGNAAGMAGLFKALCAVRHGVLYPTAHFTAPNPMIDFTGPVWVSDSLRDWPSGSPRRAGLSAFGLTGTNVHAVLEQPPRPEDDDREAGTHLVTVSAKTVAALARYRDLLADFVATTEHSLPAVAHVLNRGRDDHPYRLACTAADRDELAAALRAAVLPDRPAPTEPAVVLLFSPDAVIEDDAWSPLCAEVPELDGRECVDADPRRTLLLRQVALYRLVSAWGLADPHFVGTGAGNLAVRCAQGDLSVPAALDLIDGQRAGELNRARLDQVVRGFLGSGAVLVELGADGVLSRELRRAAPELPAVALLGGAGRRGLLDRLGRIYTEGGTLDWDRHYEHTAVTRVEVPTYPFEPVRCWVDRAPAAPAAPASPRPAEVRRVPTGDTVRHVATVWQDVLKATDLGPDSDYFAVGGTSISGISVLRRLEQDFGVALTFADLYAHRTVRGLAERVDRLRGDSRPADSGRAVTPVPRGGRLPLSFGQEQLWYLDLLNPGTPLYNIPNHLRLSGPLDVAALRGAVEDLAARHEVLRTCVRDDDGEPYVLVLPEGPALPLVDLGELSDVEQRERVLLAIDEEAVRPFDLATGPLLRTTLLRLADDDHVLLYTFHHIVFDGWSPSVFFRDLAALYRARRTGQPAGLPDLPIQYADFAAWQRSWLSGARLAAGLEFWLDHLADLRPGELPLDRPRQPTRTFVGDLVEFTIEPDLALRARAFSQRTGVTTFVTMLAVVDALLHRWAGSTDVVVGVGTSGRVDPATHDLIGYFNNLPPFRTAVSGDLTFADLVGRCARTVAAVLDHEEMPFEKIVAAVCRDRAPGRHPLYDVAYTYQNAPAPSDDMTGLTLGQYRDGNIGGIAPGTAKFDLTFGVTDQDDGPMYGYVEYAVALFDRSTAERLADWLPAMLDAALTDPTLRVDHLPGTVSVVEGVRPEPTGGELPHELVEAHAARRPDHPAVVADGRAHTYREVNRWANRLARRLIAAGVAVETPVPVILPRGVELVVAWLAVAKAGGALVPIDADLPEGRVADILAEIAAPVVLDAAWLADAGTDADEENLPRRGDPAGLAYLGFTSGSTGRPHGCQIEHRNLAGLVRWYRDEVGLTDDDRMLQVVTPGFDVSILEVWTGLCTGVTLHVLPTALEEPGRLADWLAEHRVTVAFLSTQLTEVVLADEGWSAGPQLRLLSTGGEQLRVRPLPDRPFRLLNMYGPTECTVVSTAGDIHAEGGGLPDIGRPITGMSVYLLDDRLRPVPEGRLGEIHIGGAGVGRGYRGLPGLTAARFVADPFAETPGARMYRTGDLGRLRPDGTIEFAGRIDDQVEIRGRRVEPAEIERVLAEHPAVRETVVVPTTAPSGSVRLVANVATTQPPPTEADLIGWATRRLPSYMVPSRVVLHERLPRTANGKLDRKGTKQMAMSTPAATANGAGAHDLPGATDGHGDSDGVGGRGGGSGGAALVLARICADLLSIDHVDPEDNFFQLGGDSILGVRVAARAAKAGVHFSPQQLLQYHTLRELAAVAEVTTTAAEPPVVRPVATVSTPASPIHLTPIMRDFLERMPDGAADFVMTHAMETTTHIDWETVRAAVEHLVAKHEPLRYRFRCNGIGWRIECAEPGETEVFSRLILPPLPERDQVALVAADLIEQRTRVRLADGPALRVRYYDRGHALCGWLVFLMHHFVTDNMATVVLIDDLDTALVDLLAGRPVPAPRPLLAWREWSQHLQDMATSDELAGELAYWTGVLRAGAATLDEPAGPRRTRESDAVGRGLGPDRTAAALRSGPGADEAAMCAFACALGRWQGRRDVYVMTEGAATPNVYRLTGRSPAVGWFTSLHPLLLPVDPDRSARDCLPAIADRVRSVPNDGVGYGILRHLTPPAPGLAPLRSLPEPEALVIHSTHGGAGFDSGVHLLRNRLSLLDDVPRRMPASFPLVLTSTVLDGALHMGVIHDGRYDQDRIEALADELVRAFAELAG
jgi:amino acid adenylation domain-containing protein